MLRSSMILATIYTHKEIKGCLRLKARHSDFLLKLKMFSQTFQFKTVVGDVGNCCWGFEGLKFDEKKKLIFINPP